MCLPTTPPPVDGTSTHAWFFEPKTADDNKGSLTTDGVEFIAAHKYKAGHYTHLENILNPFWTWITDLLPMTLAPNMVTLIGALHCGLAYGVLWYYAHNLDRPVPDWVIFLGGYCTIMYYTFDCMDGKQARRTNTSSPLGQLFDHGFDCICVLCHVSCVGGTLMVGGTPWLMILQVSLQLSFFLAQWEEYTTHILPHAMGNWFGVTEANYGMGLFSIANSFIDREKVYMSLMKDILPKALLQEFNYVPDVILNMELRHFALCAWFASTAVLVLGSICRVWSSEVVKKNKSFYSSMAKILTPLFIAMGPFLLPMHILKNETRYISVATGLLFSFLTKKMICFSMAKQTFATIQIEAVPYWIALLWIRCDDRITDLGARVILMGLCLWYAFRLLNWAKVAIDQICKRLGIYCFNITKKRSKKE